MEQEQREDEELRALKIVNDAMPSYRQQSMWALINWVYAKAVTKREAVKDEQLSDSLHHNPLME